MTARTTQRRRPTVVVALHDGFYGRGTGAGYSNHAILETLVALLPAGVRLVVLPVYLDSSSPEYDPAWHSTTQHLLSTVDSVVCPVENGTGGQTRFGDLREFHHLVVHTAMLLRHEILPTADPLLVVAFDVPFFGLAPLLPDTLLPQVVLAPRSTARIHDPTNAARVAWEAHGLLTAAVHGGRIAAISRHMRAHLAEDYHIPQSAIIDLPAGLTSADWQITPPEDRLLPLPARDGFVLAMGRAAPYKGFDDILDALTLLKQDDRRMPHTVLAAVTDTDQPTVYQRHLARRIQQRKLDVTLLRRFTPDIRRLLAHPALKAVVVPSRAEPFGRIPLEAHASGATPVIATTAGGLAEQICDGHTGFTAPPAHPAELANALHRGLSLTSEQRARMRHAAQAFAAGYDLTHAVQRFLAEVAPWMPSSCTTTS